HLSGRVGDPVLDRLVARELLAERLPLQRSLAQHVERAPRLTQPPHAVVDAPGPKPGLRDEKTLTALAQEIRSRHSHVLVKDLGVAVAEPLVLAGERGDVAQLLQPG